MNITRNGIGENFDGSMANCNVMIPGLSLMEAVEMKEKLQNVEGWKRCSGWMMSRTLHSRSRCGIKIR